MRFVLDHDIDVACRTWLNQNGHTAWTVGEAGRATAEDQDQSIYAQEKGAVLITHDRGFSQEKRRNAHGKHIMLKCPEPDAADVLARHLPHVLGHLRREHVTVVMSRDVFSVYSNWE